MMKKIILLASLYSGMAFAVTSTITTPASTTLTYAPTISAGVNTNITTYSSSFKWIYALVPFTVCQTGSYTGTSTTTTVVNTTFYLNGTYTPSTTFPPPTPISNFIASDFSGGLTSTVPNMNFVAGQQYSTLVAFNQTTAGSYPYTNTLSFDGPGVVVFNDSGTCPANVPTLSGWAQIILGLSLFGFAGWQQRHRFLKG